MRRGACGTENGKVRLTEHETPLYRLSLRRRDLPDWFFLIEKHARRIRAVSRAPELDPHWIVESVRATGRTELVYCAITGDAGAFALADDLMTGNCDRQVVAKMAGEMPTGHTADPWPSIVGLALDAWLKRYFANENRLAGYDRWLTDIRVRPHPSYPGTLDLYDTVTFNVIDLKGLYIHTPVPVPGGWTAIGDLQPGDKVFGSDGRPCTVTRTYPVQHRDCFRVTFDDGAELIADDRQLWAVDAGPQAQWKLLLSTVQAADSIWSRTARPQRHLRIPVSGALELPEADLPVHPYVLGCWLGDGGCYGGVISKPDDELFDNIRDCGYRVSPPLGRRGLTRTVYGLTTQLRVAGLLWVNEERRGKSHQQLTGQKLIPPAYLRASFTQRLALLRGLMDTDGTWNRPRKRAVFTTTDKQLAADTAELIRSLGWKAHIGPYTATGFGLTVTAYNVEFTPAGGNPFWLLRKADLVRTEGSARSGHRIIRSIESCLSVPTRCIDVDSPDRLFLAGPEMIPVHNCQGASTAAKLRSGGPSPRYFNQVRLYAWGMRLAGYRVDRVSIVSLPRTKSFLSEIYVWDHVLTEADDLAVIELLRRTEARRHAAQLVLSRQLPIGQVQRTPDGEECHFCDYFRVEAAHDGGPGCPGDRAPVTYPYPRAAPAA